MKPTAGSKNTKPELVVRSYLHRHGLRYRLHASDLPGSPDVLLPRFKTAIQIHGCFWHRHPGCPRAFVPKTNVDFWMAKFDRNLERDQRTAQELKRLGWRVITVWECEIRDVERLRHLVEDIRAEG